jgi:GNAT superfamily N-acetyltransferase
MRWRYTRSPVKRRACDAAATQCPHVMCAQSLTIRDASAADVPQLADLKPSATMHHDRIATASAGRIRYLVAALSGQVIGFAVLAIEQPADWPPVGPLPLLLDVMVSPSHRGRGIGTALIRAAEETLLLTSRRELFISVDPRANSRALALYCSLGFAPLHTEPYESPWSYTDSAGKVHSGVEWLIDLHKVLATEQPHA